MNRKKTEDKMAEKESGKNIGSFNVTFDKEINAKAVIAFLVFFWAMAAAWADLKRDVGDMDNRQVRIERKQVDFVTKEQLNYIVIERIDRLEKQLNDQLNRIEEKIDK